MSLDLMARLRMAKTEPWKAALPPSMLELLGAAPDPTAVLLRVTGSGDVPVLDTSGDELVQPVKTRKRKPTLASVIRAMKRAGVEIAGCEVNPRDGTVRVVGGKPSEATTPDSTDGNEWDGVLQ